MQIVSCPGPSHDSLVRAKAMFDEMARYAVATARACARLAGTEMASLKKVYEVYETTQVYVL